MPQRIFFNLSKVESLEQKVLKLGWKILDLKIKCLRKEMKLVVKKIKLQNHIDELKKNSVVIPDSCYR